MIWEMSPAEPSPGEPRWTLVRSPGLSSPEIDLEAFYAVEENLQAIEVHIDMPTSKRGWKKFSNNPEAYICSIMRKKQLEVNEKKLTKEEVLQFIQAKQKEVRNFVASECFEAEAARKHVDEGKVVGMRWLLSWKFDDDNNKKAKARAIVLGYQDPRYSTQKDRQRHPRHHELGVNCFYRRQLGDNGCWRRETFLVHSFREMTWSKKSGVVRSRKSPKPTA